jgi:hypothetical protein
LRLRNLYLWGGLLLALVSQGCKPSWTPPAAEAWCTPAEARRILMEEYAFFQAHPTESGLPAFDFGDQEITYADVAPIIQLNCWPCHRPGGNAPFPLQSYEQVQRKASTIKEVLRQRIMPPWMADNSYSTLLDAPAITDPQRATIIWWIEHGLKQGKAATSLPMVSEAVQDSADLYLTVATPHAIGSNSDSYQCFLLDPALVEDVFVEGISFHSTNPYAIHHIMLYIDTTGVLDSLPPDWDCMKDDIVNSLVPIDSWSKGQRLIRYSADFAYRFPKHTKILLQTHYGDEGNMGKLEQTTIGLHYRKTAPPREIKWAILNNLDIAIPAHQVKVETVAFPVEKDMAVLGTVPHLHFIGRVVECYAMTADCRKINLLKINDWDYLWQGRFMFPKPVVVPKGSTIYMNVLYDNTAANPQQPNDPIVDIHYDNFSNQEMMVLCVYYSDYQLGDENKTVGHLVR